MGGADHLDDDRWRALGSHLDHALDLDGEERAAWLAALRAEDAALAADIEALIEDQALLAQQGFLENGPTRPSGPESIGPYRIVRELGRGGMGLVYLAEQQGEGFHRAVALKVMEPAAAGAALERRFRDERRILAGLEHPGIARFYDAGRTPDGRGFLALEYVEGQNLLEHARQRDLPVAERIHLFLAVLEAVEFAHARSIVHRDLKPGNILVGADGRPRLLDFGIAKLVDPDPGAQGTETRTEYRALTPAYASPEQFRGESVAATSDVFSLGVVLYELLAGIRPFAAAGSSRAALERAVLSDDPDPPSTASRRAAAITLKGAATTTPAVTSHTRRTRFHRDLDAICLRALRKKPGERYVSAAAFAEDLRRYLEGRPVAARAGNRRYRLTRALRRHRGPLATCAALVLAASSVFVAAGVYHRAGRRPEPPVSRVFPFSDAGSTPIGELEGRFAAQPASAEAGAALALALSGKGRVEEAQLVLGRMRQIPGREDDPLLDYVDAMIAMAVREPQRALVLHTRARDSALARGRGELVGQIRAARGTLLATMGQLEEATAEMNLARADFERAGDDASLSRVLGDLAIAHLQRGEMARGERLLEEGVAAARRAGKQPVINLWTLGQLAMQRGRPDLAEPRMREALEFFRRSASRRRHGEAARDLSEVVRDLGRAREADSLLEQATALLSAGVKDPGLAACHFYRGAADIARGRLEGVAATVNDIERAARAAVDKRGLAFAHHLRGRAAAARGDLPRARRHFAEGSRLLVANGDRDVAAEMDLAWAAAEHEDGHAKAALAVLDDALARLGGGGRETLAWFFAEAMRARIDAEAGRTAEAHRRLQALGGDTERSPSVSRRLAFLSARAPLASAERRFADARADLESAHEAATAAQRTIEALALRLDLAQVGLAEGSRAPALAAMEEARREAASLGLGALAARARRLSLAPVGHPAP